MARSEREEFDPVRPALEGADDLGLNADRVERGDLEGLVVELDPARARDHHVDLLGMRVVVLVAYGLAPAGGNPMDGEADVLGVEIGAREAHLLRFRDSEAWGRIRHLVEVLQRVWIGHRALFSDQFP